MTKPIISLQLPGDLLDKLKALADKNCISLSAQIRILLTKELCKEKKDE